MPKLNVPMAILTTLQLKDVKQILFVRVDLLTIRQLTDVKLERVSVIPVPLTVRVIQAYLPVRLIVRQAGVAVR